MKMIHCKKYRLIANRLIKSLPEFKDLYESDVKIAYLSSEKDKRKNRKIVFADCTKVDEKYSWCCNYDFFITVYEPNIAEFTEEQIITLIRHELHHVGIDFGGNEISYYLVPHDIEEFWQIINDKGLNWSDTDAQRGTSE